MPTQLDNMITLPSEILAGGMNASGAANLALKSMGYAPTTKSSIDDVARGVMENLAAQGIKANPDLVRSLTAQALQNKSLVLKATDPVISPQPYVSPVDFTAQYPQPLDPTEILTLCEEVTTWFSGSLLQ